MYGIKEVLRENDKHFLLKKWINYLNKFHLHSPLPIYRQNYLTFLKEIHRIEKIQFYSRRKLNSYQNYLFRKLIKHVHNSVRFYKKWFRKQKLFIENFKQISDIKKLPIITKEIIRNNYDDFFSLNFKKHGSASLITTSGSTGIPFKFFLDRLALIKEYASYYRQWRIYNFKFRDKTAILRGTLVHEHLIKEQALWKHGILDKSLNLNTFNMNEENCKKIIEKILQFKPHLFRVYPMSLYILSKYVKKYGVDFPSLKLIHFSSESYTPIHRDFIKKQFRCPILDRYGQSEIALNAFECKPESGYHVEEENNLLELLDKNDDQVEEGETGRIIGTNLHNYSMPLIRYDTEDLAVLGDNECSCGRHTIKLKAIQGRILDQIISKDKSLISGISFYHYWKHRIADKIPNILFVQCIQPNFDEIIVKILPNKSYTKDCEKLIINELQKLLGNINIIFEYIDKRPDSQKWRFSISKISDTQIKSLI